MEPRFQKLILGYPLPLPVWTSSKYGPRCPRPYADAPRPIQSHPSVITQARSYIERPDERTARDSAASISFPIDIVRNARRSLDLDARRVVVWLFFTCFVTRLLPCLSLLANLDGNSVRRWRVGRRKDKIVGYHVQQTALDNILMVNGYLK